MERLPATRIEQWRIAWIALAFAIALHVTDETLSGFLPVYNALVEAIRARHPWVPLPVFTFRVWLGGLVFGILLLLALSPLLSRRPRSMGLISLLLACLMMANAFGHLGASLYWGRPAPGVYSSPVLLVSAIALLVTASRVKVRRQG